jgi:hypothetical protein
MLTDELRALAPTVIIVSRAHAPRMHAHNILLEQDYPRWFIVVDDNEQAHRCSEMGIPDARIKVCFVQKAEVPPMDRPAFAREWAEKNLIKKSEWYVSLDDNVRGWTWLPEPYYSMDSVNTEFTPEGFGTRTWRELYETPCPFERVVKAWIEMIHECMEYGTWAGGLSIENNYFFRTKKWQRLGYVRAQNAIWLNTGLPFYYWKGNMFEDFTRSVDVVARTGGVLINRFLKPIKTAFEEGGIGHFVQRKPELTAVCARLMEMYPGLLTPVKGRDYSLSFAMHSDKSVRAWREKHGYLS